MNLADAQLSLFERAGYLVVRDAVPEQLVDGLNSALDQEFAEPDGRYKSISVDGELSKIYGVAQRPRTAEQVLQLVRSDKIITALRSILGPNIVMLLNRHNHATLNSAGHNVARLHRDVLNRGVVSLIAYLEKAEVKNGCTWIVPSSQHEPRVGVPQADGGGTWMDEHEVFRHLVEQALPVPMNVGDALLFDAMAFHSVGENSTRATRRSLTLAFKAHDELGKLDPSAQVLIAGEPIYRGNDR